MTNRNVVRGFALLFVVGLSACGTLGVGKKPNQKRLLDKDSVGEFKQTIVCLRQQFQADVEAAAERIILETKDRNVRLQATLWRMSVVADSRLALRQPKMILAFESLYMLGFQMRDDLTKGHGKNAFGAQQPIAVTAANDFLETVRERIEKNTAGKGVDEIVKLVETHAAKEPFGRGFVRPAYTGEVESKKVGMIAHATSTSLEVLTAPFSPFNVRGGIDAAAVALDNFSTVASAFEDTARNLPEDARWQLELLLYRLDGLESLQRAVASIERVAENSGKLSKVAETMPANIEEKARSLLADIEAKQPGLRETLAAAKATVTELQPVAKDAAEVTRGLAAAGSAWDGAIVSFDKMADKFRTPEGAPPPPPDEVPGRPFDIREYTETAKHLTKAASELRALTIEVDRVAHDDALTARIDDVEKGAAATIDHAAWRAFQLILTIFVAALLFVLIRVKLIDRRRSLQ